MNLISNDLLTRFFIIYSLLLISFSLVGSKVGVPNYDILPKPVMLKKGDGFSSIKTIVLNQNQDIEQFVPWVLTWCKAISVDKKDINTYLIYDSEIAPGKYKLFINKRKNTIAYSSPQSLRNALSTLWQLKMINGGKLPLVELEDVSHFEYRGMHLDVARHMFSVDDIKSYLDYLAFYKFNKFHWHLTEDQGWRIEIKSFPRLQTVAAYRKETLIGHYNDIPHQFDGKKYGGYYTQKEIKEIVAYAQSRGIEVIPEIDIPGHSLALLSAYPELGCENKRYETATKWGVFSDVLCPKEETFHFLEKVFDEVIDLFPGKYIHIGGDECPKVAWKKSKLCQDLIQKHYLRDERGLQSYFIKRIETYINSKGKMIIGWDEILEGGLAPNATIMSWRGVLGGIEAANNDHDVIMTPTSHCYFDYYQSDGPDEPLAIGGYLPVKKVYQWNPIPNEIPTEKKKYIIGGQGNVWTEYITDFKKVEYMALTRMITLSEVLWGKNTKSYDAFASHLYTHIKYWQSVGANIANHIFEPTLTGTIIKNQGVGLKAINLPKGTQTQIKPPNQNSYQVFSNPYLLDTSGIYSVKSSFENIESQPHSVLFEPHLGNFGQIELKCQPASKYAGSGNDCLINGIEGSNIKYGGSEWLGFLGKNFDAIISFTEAQKISSVSIKCFNGEGQWIYLPDSVFIFSIDEKERERLIAQSKIEKSQMKTIRNTLTFNPIVTEKIRIQVKNFGVIPEGRQGAGHKAWLFLDEIIIK